MEVANPLAYNAMAKITAIKSFIAYTEACTIKLFIAVIVAMT
jgi:hypothetical protein